MKILLALLGGMVLLVVFIGLIGAALPRRHRVSSRIRTPVAASAAWSAVRNLGGLADWWSEITAMEPIAGKTAHEVWRQESSFGAATITVLEEVPGRRLRTGLDAGPGAAFGGTWLHEVHEDEGMTVVTVTEDGWVSNPFYRLLMRIGGPHRTMDGYLRALARHLGEPAEPEHVKPEGNDDEPR